MTQSQTAVHLSILSITETTDAMASVVSVMLNMDKWTAVWLCVIIALVYAILSGFWGVVVTDLVQFFIAMFGSIALAIIALNYVGGMPPT